MSVPRTCGLLVALLIFNLMYSVVQAADIGLTLHRIDSSQFPTVRAYLSVVDSQGVPIERLPKEAFSLVEKDAPITDFQVESIVDSQEPVAVALVIDISGSMKDEGRMDGAKQAASEFVGTLGPRDTAAVMSFDDKVEIVQGYTSDRAALKAAIDKLGPRNDTALYDAIFQAAQLQGAVPQQRKVILVLTDGEDTASARSIDDSVAAVKGASTYLITVGLGAGVKKETLETIAGSTGGRAILVANNQELKDVFLQIGDQLRRQYVLTYSSTLPADDATHELTVKVDDRGRTAEAKGPFTAMHVAMPVEVKGITSAAKVSGKQPIEVTTGSAVAKEVELLVDDQSRGKLNAAPYVFQWDTTAEQPGIHRVVIRATDSTGAKTDKEFIVEVVGAAASPTAAPTAATGAVASPTPVQTPTAMAPPAGSESNTLLYVAAAVLALALIGGGVAAFLFLRGRKLNVQLPTSTADPKPVVSDRTEIVDVAPARVAEAPNVPTSAPVVSPPPPPPAMPVVSEPAPQSTIVSGDGASGATMVSGGTVVPTQPRARLRIDQGGAQSEVVIAQAETILGRESTNPIVVTDPMASRRHAKIVIENAEFWIEDLKSLNGTRVNGEVITRRKLSNADQIKIGDTVLTFTSESS